MAMYVDEYGALDTAYIVHLFPLNRCEEHGPQTYAIGVLLHVGTKGYRCALEYPHREERDAAFEAIGALLPSEGTMYVDEYGALDTAYVVHLFLLNPCQDHGLQTYAIGALLHVGSKGYRCALEYPRREYRDAAFEAIADLLRAEGAVSAAPEEEEDEYEH